MKLIIGLVAGFFAGMEYAGGHKYGPASIKNTGNAIESNQVKQWRIELINSGLSIAKQFDALEVNTYYRFLTEFKGNAANVDAKIHTLFWQELKTLFAKYKLSLSGLGAITHARVSTKLNSTRVPYENLMNVKRVELTKSGFPESMVYKMTDAELNSMFTFVTEFLQKSKPLPPKTSLYYEVKAIAVKFNLSLQKLGLS